MTVQNDNRPQAPRKTDQGASHQEERWLGDFANDLAPLSLSCDDIPSARPGEMWFEKDGKPVTPKSPHRHGEVGI